MYQESEESRTLSRREREKLAHRREIIEAAIGVFSKKGFFSATLDEVAQAADFSKGTLYLYFESKEDLLYNIIYEKMKALFDASEEIIGQPMSFYDKLRTLFRATAQKAMEERSFHTLMMSQHAAGFKAMSKDRAGDLKKMHDSFFEKLRRVIEMSVHSGEIRDLSADIIVGLIHGTIENMMITTWDSATNEELYGKIDQFLDLLFNGIGKEREDGRCTEDA